MPNLLSPVDVLARQLPLEHLRVAMVQNRLQPLFGSIAPIGLRYCIMLAPERRLFLWISARLYP